jgi:hypothetical protein
VSTRFSRLLLAGGQNAVPFSGWFLGGWSPGTTLAIFWVENVVLTGLIAARIAAHSNSTRKRGHQNGFLGKFLLTSLAFTLAHGLFLAFILFGVMDDNSVNRDDLVAGIQWMLLAQGASLMVDLWFIGNWPFAEVRARVDWMMGRVVVAHLSILFGMFAFMAMGQPWWFFSAFLVLKALMDVAGLLPKWQYQPKTPPAWLARAVKKLPKGPNTRGLKDETFEQYWERMNREEAARLARDEEVVDA